MFVWELIKLLGEVNPFTPVVCFKNNEDDQIRSLLFPFVADCINDRLVEKPNEYSHEVFVLT